MTARHRPPRDCPVCGAELAITRLGCAGCGSEITGVFSSCEFCALGPGEQSLLKAFLAARGNIKEIERRLGVSYPTARAKIEALLRTLGLDDPGVVAPRLEVLHAVAGGQMGLDAALAALDEAGGPPPLDDAPASD